MNRKDRHGNRVFPWRFSLPKWQQNQRFSCCLGTGEDLVVTGPTDTNVNDVAVALIRAEDR